MSSHPDVQGESSSSAALRETQSLPNMQALVTAHEPTVMSHEDSLRWLETHYGEATADAEDTFEPVNIALQYRRSMRNAANLPTETSTESTQSTATQESNTTTTTTNSSMPVSREPIWTSIRAHTFTHKFLADALVYTVPRRNLGNYPKQVHLAQPDPMRRYDVLRTLHEIGGVIFDGNQRRPRRVAPHTPCPPMLLHPPIGNARQPATQHRNRRRPQSTPRTVMLLSTSTDNLLYHQRHAQMTTTGGRPRHRADVQETPRSSSTPAASLDIEYHAAPRRSTSANKGI